MNLSGQPVLLILISFNSSYYPLLVKTFYRQELLLVNSKKTTGPDGIPAPYSYLAEPLLLSILLIINLLLSYHTVVFILICVESVKIQKENEMDNSKFCQNSCSQNNCFQSNISSSGQENSFQFFIQLG